MLRILAQTARYLGRIKFIILNLRLVRIIQILIHSRIIGPLAQLDRAAAF